MVILAVFLGVAFAVSAVLPAEVAIQEEFKPLEVTKEKISGPAVLVINNEALWELQITVTNNLELNPVEVVDDVDDLPDTPNLFVPSTTTRADGEVKAISLLDDNTITNIEVFDVLPFEFTLFDFVMTQGEVALETDEAGSTLITWKVGNLAPKTQATLDLTVVVPGFSKPGTYLLNGGATASGILHSNSEVLTDGPTNSILVTVTDGTPNEPPIAEAGVDQMAFEDYPIYLEGSGSYDPDGTIVKYTWYVGDEHVGSSKSVLTYYFPVGEYEVTLFVEDNRGAVDSDTVTITIYKENAKIPGGVMYGTVRDATTRQGCNLHMDRHGWQLQNNRYSSGTLPDILRIQRISGLLRGSDGHWERRDSL
jgi:hypothetical protein